MQFQPYRFSVAPMMDWTDRHCRVFHRFMTRRALLYTEMVTAAAVVRGDRERLIGFDAQERPVALQLGGSEPGLLAEAARIGADFGYNEINLNVGCPSDRVQSGTFGACLMAEPELVAQCVAAMQTAVEVPVTVKCRIGIDEQDSEADLDRFVRIVSQAGCERFIIHARKAWLKGLSPKENRDIPPLDYDRVHRLKAAHPDLAIVLNGGLQGLDDALPHLEALDGVMLGRAAYQRPYILADVDRRVFGDDAKRLSRTEIFSAFIDYAHCQLVRGVPLPRITRHVLGLAHGCPGARRFRRLLSDGARQPGAEHRILSEALSILENAERSMVSTPGSRMVQADSVPVY